ncbi:MAG: energy transducer TonB [Deltaproteobacteria bacterium]|nr:energy transducer TonB [Deltaproteobacteria bacterium]
MAAAMAIGLHALLFSVELRRTVRKEVAGPVFKAMDVFLVAARPVRKPEVPVSRPEETPVPAPQPAPALPETVQKKIAPEARVRTRPAKKDVAPAPEPAPVPVQPALPSRSEEDPRKETPMPGTVRIPSETGRPAIPEASLPPTLREAIPMYRRNPAPEYPEVARRRGYEGTVMLDLLVNREGRVSDVRLSRSCGFPLLDRAAMTAVKGWFFEPATRGAEPAEMWVKVPIRFELK